MEMIEGEGALIDGIKPEYIEFIENGFGLLYFGDMPVNIYYYRDVHRRLKFSFLSVQEGWEVFGRGFCQLRHEELRGLITLKDGIWSEFTAKKAL